MTIGMTLSITGTHLKGPSSEDNVLTSARELNKNTNISNSCMQADVNSDICMLEKQRNLQPSRPSSMEMLTAYRELLSDWKC